MCKFKMKKGEIPRSIFERKAIGEHNLIIKVKPYYIDWLDNTGNRQLVEDKKSRFLKVNDLKNDVSNKTKSTQTYFNKYIEEMELLLKLRTINN